MTKKTSANTKEWPWLGKLTKSIIKITQKHKRKIQNVEAITKIDNKNLDYRPPSQSHIENWNE